MTLKIHGPNYLCQSIVQSPFEQEHCHLRGGVGDKMILLSECLYKVIGCDASGWECLCVVFDYKQSDFQIPQGPMFINKIQAGYKKESKSKDSFERRL